MRLGRRALLAGLGSWTALPLAHAAPGRRIAKKRTKFGRLEVRREADLIVMREDGQIHSAVDPNALERLVYPYLQVMDELVAIRTKSGGRALVVGLGGGTFSRKLLARGFEVTGVDINPHAVDLARAHMHLDPRIEVHIEDGRTFVERSPQKCDLVVLDAQSENYVPPHLLTVEWFEAVRSILAPGGWVLMNSWHHAPRADDELTTIHAAFEQTWVVWRDPSDYDNRILLGIPAGSTPDLAKLPANTRYRQIDHPMGTALWDAR